MICETNLMQQLWFIKQPLAQHVSGTIMPIFREREAVYYRIWFPALNALAGVLGSREAGRVCCVEAVIQPNNSLYTAHTTCLPGSQESSQHIKRWKPYAVIHGLELLQMGIMVLKICRANALSINHNCCIKLVSQIISL
jgi:hypothetical protein